MKNTTRLSIASFLLSAVLVSPSFAQLALVDALQQDAADADVTGNTTFTVNESDLQVGDVLVFATASNKNLGVGELDYSSNTVNNTGISLLSSAVTTQTLGQSSSYMYAYTVNSLGGGTIDLLAEWNDTGIASNSSLFVLRSGSGSIAMAADSIFEYRGTDSLATTFDLDYGSFASSDGIALEVVGSEEYAIAAASGQTEKMDNGTSKRMSFSSSETAVTSLLNQYTLSGTETNENEAFTGLGMYFTVVPEPGTYAALAGICALTSVMLRRRRA